MRTLVVHTPYTGHLLNKTKTKPEGDIAQKNEKRGGRYTESNVERINSHIRNPALDQLFCFL